MDREVEKQRYDLPRKGRLQRQFQHLFVKTV